MAAYVLLLGVITAFFICLIEKAPTGFKVGCESADDMKVGTSYSELLSSLMNLLMRTFFLSLIEAF